MSDVESPRSSRSGRRRPTALSRLAARKKHEDSDDGSDPMSKISTPRLVLKKYLGCDKSNSYLKKNNSTIMPLESLMCLSMEF